MKYTFISAFALMALTACSTFKPVRDSASRHLLEPLVPDRALTATTPAIAINRPSIPNYLDRMQLITRKDGQLMMSPIHLWAESLDVGISRVMASNLSRLTGSMSIQSVESFTTLDYAHLLELKITQFEPDAADQMILQGTWKLQPVTGKETSPHFFRLSVPIPITELPMTARVTAMNQALEQLSRQIGL
ncbi:MAG: PqiC family protein [Prosthecobacter sp.]